MEVKVLLVDDELLIRLGIKSIIDWERHGFAYLGDAPDGEQALEMMDKELPDILLTDIVMPRMDGLKLIEAVRARYPRVRIIVLSSHNEYDYLRAAMKLGVQDYLLKASMKPEELLELLQEMAEQIRADHRGLSMREGGQPPAAAADKARADWLHRVLAGVDAAEEMEGELADELQGELRGELEGELEDELRGELKDELRGELKDELQGELRGELEGKLQKERIGVSLREASRLLLLRVHQLGSKAADLQQNRTTLHNLIELELHKWRAGCVFPYRDNEWVVLLPEGPDGRAGGPAKVSVPARAGIPEGPDGRAGEPTALKQAQLIGRDLISAARRFLNVSMSIGISRSFTGTAQIRSAYREAERVLQLYFVDGKEKVYTCEEYALPDSAPFLITKDEVRRLKSELNQLHEEGAVAVVRAIFDRMRQSQSPVDRSIQACLQLLHVIQYESSREESPLYKQVLGFEQLEEARAWFEKLVRDSIQRAKDTLRESHREEIMKLLVHMKSHYKQDLSLKKAARLVNMSESYLSFLFKKEMNISFTEYMNQLRIEKAAELLLDTDLPSYRIAEEVGYENNNYFGRVFKKVKGISPQQYRSQHQR
ncbi:response regulator [Paenibacillus senegalensis]|uniref:response regulator n=1 Tax=Paenibacillus senegalensis TaxID=1465766 RepID=UPI000289F642|nr:response regulator [Paenibacillus senegalensis]